MRTCVVVFLFFLIVFSLLDGARARSHLKHVVESSRLNDAAAKIPLKKLDERSCEEAAERQFDVPTGIAWDEDLIGTFGRILRKEPSGLNSMDLWRFLTSARNSVVARIDQSPAAYSANIRIVYRFRLLLSVIQTKVCKPSWLLALYDGVLQKLLSSAVWSSRKPSTLEEFWLRQLQTAGGLVAADEKFIAGHMIDTNLNNLILSRLGAHRTNSVASSSSTVDLICERLSSMGVGPRTSSAEAPLDLATALEQPGCVFVTASQSANVAKIAPSRISPFSVLRAPGLDIKLSSSTPFAPVLDTSIDDPPAQIAKLNHDPQLDAAAFPLVVALRAFSPNGSQLKFLDRFSRLVFPLHILLKKAKPAPLDTRAFSEGKRGGDMYLEQEGGIPVKTLYVRSSGQDGARAAGAPEGGRGVDTTLSNAALQEFLWDAGASIIDGSNDSLVLGSAPSAQLLRRLFTNFGGRQGYPDFQIDIPLDALDLLTDPERGELADHCKGSATDACLEDLVRDQFHEFLERHSQLCRTSDQSCDAAQLRIGETAHFEGAQQGLTRIPAPSGRDGAISYFYRGTSIELVGVK